jgi:uncharacterized cofD-like protein
MGKVRVVGFGGGNGLKNLADAQNGICDFTGIVAASDDMGSTGDLRSRFPDAARGYIGDLTRSLVALSKDEEFRQVMEQRVDFLPGNHSLKNLFLFYAEKLYGREKGIDVLRRVSGTSHHIFPATVENIRIRALTVEGWVEGDKLISDLANNPLFNKIIHTILKVELVPRDWPLRKIYDGPPIRAYVPALQALKRADRILIAPGSFATSILAALAPDGYAEVIKKSSAQLVLFLNLMTTAGETDDYSAGHFVEMLEDRLSRGFDVIVYNTNPIPQEALDRYGKEEKRVTVVPEELHNHNHNRRYKLIGAPLAAVTPKGYVYHSPSELRKVMKEIVK